MTNKIFEILRDSQKDEAGLLGEVWDSMNF